MYRKTNAYVYSASPGKIIMCMLDYIMHAVTSGHFLKWDHVLDNFPRY